MEYNFDIFARKLVDGVYSGLRNKWKNLWQEKKNAVKFCFVMPRGTSGQEFLLEYNVGVFARKLVDSIFGDPRYKFKNLLQEKKIS